ncbi:endonuclease IV [Methanolobus tindarius DSM 2278]|uniref:Endonuclease IV n=2 Tax=Methanolobus tindarius TaxID=2221 RepID=W9DN88_METTI|nr:endonuclease IV [Methanolobus tindarius DSM 2278]
MVINMKFGLKLWSTNNDLLPDADQLIKSDVFQYIELTPIPHTDISSFLSYDIPYTIHITTERHGVNIGNKNNHNSSLEAIYHCIKWADKLDAKYMVLHPGYGSIEDSIELLDKLDDERILIENMPKKGLNDEMMIGYMPEQIEKLMDNKFGFCFDMNHAIKAAASLDIDYRPFIESFISKLSPCYFHISDGDLKIEIDQHLSIGEGEYDFYYLFGMLNEKSETYITVETPKPDIHSLNEDVKNVEKLKTVLKTTY